MIILKDFIKTIKNSLGDEEVFVDKNTGEIKTIEGYYLNISKTDEKRIAHKWQRELVQEGERILKSGDYFRCNIKADINEYKLMEDFLKKKLSEEERGEIEFIINGENRLKRFHLAILGTYFENLWDIFLEEEIESLCKKWLYEREINYI